MKKIITDVQIRNMSEGQRAFYTYSTVDDTGKIIDNNAKGSFVVLDDMAVEINGQFKNVKDAANVLFKAAENSIGG